jgi:alpha-1,3/alpha-1,6-mannosyltransferase
VHVAFIHPDLGIGGAERLVVDAARSLLATGHRVTIFTARHDRQRSFEETRSGALDVRVYGERLPAHVAQRLRAPCAIARMSYLAGALALQRTHIDVVVCDLVAHAIPLLRLLVRAPVVFYCHFPDVLLTPPRRSVAYRAYRRPIDRLEGLGLRLADRILVNSQFTADRLQEAFPQRRFAPQVLHPGIDAARYAGAVAGNGAPRADTPPTVLSIARYAGAKNVGLAIDAFAALRQRLPAETAGRCRLVVAGGYDEQLQECRDTRDALRSQVRRLGVADQVQFLFSVSDAERLRLLARCRCVVYTPVDEHFGFVPLEAMASGRPVVAVDSGGVRETVRNGETGFLCVPTVDAFADALACLMLDPAAARRMGQAGRAHVTAHFSDRLFGARLEALLTEVVGQRTPRGAAC